MRQIFLTSMFILLLTGCSGKKVLPTPVGELKALDNFWKVLISKTSWMQNHIHFLFTKRTKNSSEEIFRELKKIKLISENVKKQDPFFWRRILPTPVYKFYKKMKFFFT